MMQMVDSRQQQLSSEQIIEIAAANTKTNRPMKQVKQMLTVEFSMPNVWRMQQGNTIFVVHKTTKPGGGFFRALNADTARNFLANSQVFMRAAYQVGFDTVVTQFDDPTLLNIFRMIARTQPANMGYAVQRTEGGGYQVTLKLGQPRTGAQ